MQDARRIDVGVIRIRAGNPAQREGAIFFNNGGPGSHPGKLLRSLAEAWSGMSLHDPDEREKRQLSDRYDLVAVIPRGLVGSSEFRCVSELPPRHAFLPTHQDDANWQLAVAEAQAAASACTAPEHARYLNTEQHAHDMDMLREVLGDERLHFYGISYGGMVGAWYASIYPTHTGRLLLDSSMDFTHGYRAATLLAMTGRERAFNEDAVQPVLENPSLYGLGTDPVAVTTAIDQIPTRAREVWAGRLNSPVRLAAALRVAGWLATDRPPTVAAMERLIERARFSSDPAVDRRLRWEAGLAAAMYYAAPPATVVFEAGVESESVRVAMGCNDNPWLRSDAEIRASIRRYAARSFDYTAEEVPEELTCARWGGPSARRPDISILGRATPFLLIQSEKDRSTPLAGASHILEEFSNARMLLVRGSRVHGLFNFTRSMCVERTAARYLLTGALPAAPSRAFTCDQIPDNPVDAMPGGTMPAAVEPTPTEAPVVSHQHDEL